MSDDSSARPTDMHPVFVELHRLFGTYPSGFDAGFLLLPLITEADGLAFLRGLPVGTRWEDLPSLASAWREAHPKDDVRDL